MKVELYVVKHENHEGLYTESELEDLKQELLEDYREDEYGLIRDVYDTADCFELTKAALNYDGSQQKIQEVVENCEEQYWNDFMVDYVDTYVKEL